MAVTSDPQGSARGSWIYDPKVRGVIFQTLLVVAVLAFVFWIVSNTVSNLAAQDKKTGFAFLEVGAGFAILPTLGTTVMDYKVGTSTYLDVFIIGVINTFIVAFLGIIAATLLGFVMGVFRLSKNFVLRGFSTVYVEVFRNIPLLLHLFFWYFAVLRQLPGPREAGSFGIGGVNITGLYLPAPVPQGGMWLVAIGLLIGLLLAWLVARWATKRQEATGQQFPAFWVGLALIVLIPLAVYVVAGYLDYGAGESAQAALAVPAFKESMEWSAPLTWEMPVFTDTGPILRRGYEAGVGMQVIPEMIAVWLALTLYTAAFIAEIVRAGILAINHGQTEAAHALGLRQGLNLRKIVIPQALRVIIPPLTSQYLNLTKNSSLAVAIAYPELVSIYAGTALNQVGQEIEMIFMMMLVYLTFSLLTSAFMNWFNNRMQLVER